jgi:hypothetical protein
MGLWNLFKVFRLTQNQRVLNAINEDPVAAQNNEGFAEWALSVGDGEVPVDDDEYMEIPDRQARLRRA